MSTMRKRLEDVEARKAFRNFVEAQRQFEGRAQDELRFFSIHGYFPEAAHGELPDRQDFAVASIRTIISTEKMGRG